MEKPKKPLTSDSEDEGEGLSSDALSSESSSEDEYTDSDIKSEEKEEKQMKDNSINSEEEQELTFDEVVVNVEEEEEEEDVIEEKKEEKVSENLKGIFSHGNLESKLFEDYAPEQFLTSLTCKLVKKCRDDLEKKMDSDEEFKVIKENINYFSLVFKESLKAMQKVDKRNLRELKAAMEEDKIAREEFKTVLESTKGTLDTLTNKIEDLENGLSKVGNETILSGNVLETLDGQMKRAKIIKKCLDVFNEMNNYDPNVFLRNLEKKNFKYRLLNEKRREKALVEMLQQMGSILIPELKGKNGEGSIESCDNGIVNFELFYKDLRKSLKERFGLALQTKDYRLIRKRAKILLSFNSEEDCIDTFVEKIYQDLIEMQPMELTEKEEDELDYDSEASDGYEEDLKRINRIKKKKEREKKKSKMGMKSESSEKVDETVKIEVGKKLFQKEIERSENERIRKTAIKEKENKFFEQYKNKKMIFELLRKIENICYESSGLLENVFHEKELRTLAYRKMFEHLLENVAKPAIKEIFKNFESQETGNFLLDLNMVYIRCLEFIQRINDSSKFDMEKDFLKVFFDKIFEDWKNVYISKELDFLKQSKEKELSKSQENILSHIMRENQIPASPSKKRISILPALKKKNEVAYMLRLEVIRNIQHRAEESIKRCKILSNEKNKTTNVVKIFQSFIDFANEYLVNALTTSIKKFTDSTDNYTKQPETAMICNDILYTHMMMEIIERFLDEQIIKNLNKNVVQISKCNALKNKLFSILEDLIGSCLEDLLIRILRHSEHLLKSLYKKNDYRVGDFNTLQSNYCVKVLEFFYTQYRNIKIALHGQNLELFLEKWGYVFYEKFYQFLIDKVKVKTSSKGGAVIFQQDIKQFKKFFLQFKSKQLDKAFDELVSLGGLFNVKDENVENVCKKLISENVKKQSIVKFLKMREGTKNEIPKILIK